MMSGNNGRKSNELKAWHLLLEDDAYRLDQPEPFHASLIQRADELVLQEVLSLDEWQALKDVADDVYNRTLATLANGGRDRLDTRTFELGIPQSEYSAGRG
jgi:hypothetical protein